MQMAAVDTQEYDFNRQLFMKLCIKVIVFWDVAPCSLRNNHCLCHQGYDGTGCKQLRNVCKFYRTVRHSIREENRSYIRRRENLKLNVVLILCKY
jgi:hypothetical protein